MREQQIQAGPTSSWSSSKASRSPSTPTSIASRPAQRLELFIPVCQAVQHAHQKGIIHRDLKPTNVLVADYDDRPVPKVIDFGVAKAIGQHLTERTMFTQLGQVVGTIEYMSPEQAKLNQLDIDTRTDIYSLGVLLYELLTGETPFDRQRLRSAAFDEMLRIIREEEPPKPSTRLSSSQSLPSIAAQRQLEPKRLTTLVAGDLDWIVMKSLEKDRARRYQTATGLADDLQRYLTDQPVAARRPTRAYRLKKFIRRNKVGVLASSAVAAALIVGLVLASLGFVQARRQAQIAIAEAAKATAISDLLQEALQSANPDGAKGSEYTVRQLLAEVSSRLQNQLHGQPEAEAAVHATIGTAYRRLLLLDEAQPHLTTALDIRRRLFGPDHAEVAQSLRELAWYYLERHDLVAGDARAREALAIHRKLGLRNGDTIAILSILQIILNCEGEESKLHEADDVANEVLAISRDLPDTCPDVATVLHNQADTAIRLGDPVRAEKLARQSVELHRKLHGSNHPETAWSLAMLGRALEQQHRYDEAEPCFRETLSILRKQFSTSHGSVSVATEDLARVLGEMGDQAGATNLRIDAIGQQWNLEPSQAQAVQYMTAKAMADFAFSILLKATATAETVFQHCIETFKQLAKENPDKPEIRNELARAYAYHAQCLSQLGRESDVAETIDEYGQAIDLWKELSQADPDST